MLTRVILFTYRVIAINVILSPIAFNVVIRGDVVPSLVYIPLLSLALLLACMYLDSKLEQILIAK